MGPLCSGWFRMVLPWLYEDSESGAHLLWIAGGTEKDLLKSSLDELCSIMKKGKDGHGIPHSYRVFSSCGLAEALM